MLANFRHSSFLKIFQLIFAMICFVMIASPLLSAFGSTASNPVLFQSPGNQITLKDLFSRDNSLLQTLYSLSSANQEATQFAVKQYYRPFSYKDFFEKYGCTLSDAITWDLFLKQFGSQISAEQYASIEQTIKQHFGTKKRFLAEMKMQLLAQKIQDQLIKVIEPIKSKNNVLSTPLQYTIKQYNFSPKEYASKAIPSSVAVLKDYYEKHTQSYIAPAMVNVHALFLQPSLLNLNTVAPHLITQAHAHLASLGYDVIDERLVQKKLFDDLIEAMQEKNIHSLSEFQQLYSSDLIAQTRSLDNAQASQVDEMFAGAGLFNMMQHHFEEQITTTPLFFIPQDAGVWVIEPSHYQSSQLPPYPQVAAQVLQDWTAETAGLLAQQASTNFVQNYKEAKASWEKPTAEYTTRNIFLDHRLPNPIKMQLAHLIAADLDRDLSITVSFDGQLDSGVKVFTLENVSFSPSAATESHGADTKELTASQQDLNPIHFAHQSAMLKAFDNSIDASFGYKIQPELWSLLDRFNKQHEEAFA